MTSRISAWRDVSAVSMRSPREKPLVVILSPAEWARKLLITGRRCPPCGRTMGEALQCPGDNNDDRRSRYRAKGFPIRRAGIGTPLGLHRPAEGGEFRPLLPVDHARRPVRRAEALPRDPRSLQGRRGGPPAARILPAAPRGRRPHAYPRSLGRRATAPVGARPARQRPPNPAFHRQSLDRHHSPP